MASQPQLLIASEEPELTREIKAALDSLSRVRAVVHEVHRLGNLSEAVRNRQPNVVFLPMSGDLSQMRHWCRDIEAAAPHASVVAVFSPEIFPPDEAESVLLIQVVRCGVADFLRRPVSSKDLAELLERLLTAGQEKPQPQGGLAAFISNKGGIGKSTLAVNLAAGLARKFPEKVLLVDLSLQMGVCANLLDLQPKTSVLDVWHERDRLDETLIRQLAVPHSSGLDLLAAPTDAVEAAVIDDQIVSRLLTLARRAYDYVIVDTFPLLDRVVMAVLDLSQRYYVVLDNVVPTVLSVNKLLELLQSVGLDDDRLRLILNRYTTSAGNPNVEEVAQRLGREIDYVIPWNRQMIAAANTGRPYILDARTWWGVGKALHQLAEESKVIRDLAREISSSDEAPANAQAEGPTLKLKAN